LQKSERTRAQVPEGQESESQNRHPKCAALISKTQVLGKTIQGTEDLPKAKRGTQAGATLEGRRYIYTYTKISAPRVGLDF
jgi:hypothetical protein